ncbi:serine/threonine-protein kinase [Pseudofrankia sp. BMG5.36]|uniref:serine/threonine-protein kinase n=1 Tax=Pseudofrankia sp. BMG5.36 TaxID=1834512 RepID=UPI0008D96C74|nr:serine/threonine-protein kinase [Pseudofrankia sp. BMG5.36]OHV44343.1 serine/threonine protein kinase [Pseudofrankia sp. BMG5.36]
MTEDVAGAARRPASGVPGEHLASHDPRRIGPYALLSRLGTGGMGTVYLGRGPAGRLVAVKVIRPDLAADEEFRRRFRQEVAAARRVAPFCTAEVLDADPDAAAPYLVTEFIDGLRLDQAIARGGPLMSSTLTGLAVGVATALTAIHRAGLIHRDLKPSNVLLSLSGPRVIDFGIAQAVAADSKAKPTSWGFGSAGWMAPEQINGQSIGPAADVFTWGILMAYAGTGRHPFGEGQDIDLAYRTVSAEPDLTGLVPPLYGVVAAALAKDPDARPSARDLLLALVETGPTGGAGLAPGEELLGLAADRADVMAGPVVAALTGPDLHGPDLHGPDLHGPGQQGPGQQGQDQGGAGQGRALPRTRVAPPGYGATNNGPTGQRPPGSREAAQGYVPPNRGQAAHPGAPGEIVSPRRPSTPVGGERRWPGGGPPGGGPGGPPPARRRGPGNRGSRVGLWLTVLLLVLGAAAIAAIALNPGASSDDGSGSSGTSKPTAPGTPTPTERVYRDGSLEFIIKDLRCGVTEIGVIIKKHPDGQYCLVKVSVHNTGNTARGLVANQQFMFDQSGGKHEAYSGSRWYFLESLWNSIKPGGEVSGTLVFDIPSDAHPSRLELHDGLLGDGVTIQL